MTTRGSCALTLAQAQAQYPHRFTLEHVPAWAKLRAPNGRFYAPQYRTDSEWFALTRFPTDRRERYCTSSGQTWPMGLWLDQPLTS